MDPLIPSLSILYLCLLQDFHWGGGGGVWQGNGLQAGEFKKNSNSWMLEEPRECGVPCLPTLLH